MSVFVLLGSEEGTYFVDWNHADDEEDGGEDAVDGIKIGQP
jgi:hypothetical protein